MKKETVLLAPRASFGKEIQNVTELSVEAPTLKQRTITAVPKPQASTPSAFLTPARKSKTTNDSPFSLRLVKIESPVRSD